MMAVCVADIPVCFRGNGTFSEELTGACRSFVGDGGGGEGSRAVLEISVEGREGVARDTDVVVEREEERYRIRSGEYEGAFDFAAGTGELKIRWEESVFGSFLRVLYSILLARNDGFLIHSAGIERNGSGYLFPGPSSSGKTTLARGVKGFRVLSDELVAVRRDGGGFRAFSTPFRGEFEGEVEPRSAGLKAMVFMNGERGGADGRIEREQPLDAAMDLMSNVFFFLRDKDSSSDMLELCCDLTNNVPAFRSGYLDAARIGDLIGTV